MPTNGRPKLTVRMDPELHDRFNEACEAAGEAGAEHIREFVRWTIGDTLHPPRRLIDRGVTGDR